MESPDLRRLVAQALDEFEQALLSVSHRRALRVAQLRRDLPSLWWLAMEHGSVEHRRQVRANLAPHSSGEEYKRLHYFFRERYIEERTVRPVTLEGPQAEELVETSSIADIERKIANLTRLETTERSQGEPSLATWAASSAAALGRVLEDIRARIFDFLTHTEAQLAAGQEPEILVRTRVFVLTRLGEVAPQAVEQIGEAERAVQTGQVERYSHAVLSCRRALKSLADVLYPATDDEAVGRDGVSRQLTDDQYINRLWQFVSDTAGGPIRRCGALGNPGPG